MSQAQYQDTDDEGADSDGEIIEEAGTIKGRIETLSWYSWGSSHV